MIVLKVLAIIAIVLVALFLLTLVIYFFNLDMKFAAFNQAAYCILQLVKEQAREKERTEYTERITGRAETSNGFI